MASETFEQRIERACRDKEIPGILLVGDDREGNFRYEEVFGNRSLKDPSKGDPMTKDATMWMASCSKFPTSVAVMQCVERGQLSLDDDVTGLLPELKGLPILTKFDEGDTQPTITENTKPITLRQLLTHSSGITYDIFSPTMTRYRIAVDKYTPTLDIKIPLTEALKYPLVFEPGTSWESGGTTPFGTAADPEAPVEYTENWGWSRDMSDCSGGAGLFGNVIDYQKLLHSICADDGKLLKKETVDYMFQDHLSAASKAVFNKTLENPALREILGGGVMAGMEITHGLGGMIFLKNVDGGRRAGTIAWGGYPNLLWFCDRKAGLSGIAGSQMVPSGDPKFNRLFALWEQELYKRAGKGKL
ncbi:Acyltransferase [Lachnellula willkommii]|uniref:Acyltransferase n=1 Tax=Lachnellula willkommii TaxID=215461 RepID=A0A559M338_9HELO|nr:Acyltransferase [Lachnellula willkommii]